jgi:hypothetical protein
VDETKALFAKHGSGVTSGGWTDPGSARSDVLFSPLNDMQRNEENLQTDNGAKVNGQPVEGSASAALNGR